MDDPIALYKKLRDKIQIQIEKGDLEYQEFTDSELKYMIGNYDYEFEIDMIRYDTIIRGKIQDILKRLGIDDESKNNDEQDNIAHDIEYLTTQTVPIIQSLAFYLYSERQKNQIVKEFIDEYSKFEPDYDIL